MMEIDARIAARLKDLRAASGWSLDQLAQASGVSRGMLSKIERGETSATAALLSRVAAAFELPLSQLLGPPEPPRLVQRRLERPRWQDPATGFIRETVSPPLSGSGVEIVEIELPPHTRMPCGQPAAQGHALHLLALTPGLRIRQAEATDLEPGDALFTVPAGEFVVENTSALPCRCLVVTERTRSLR